jgi:hypothetical protein
MYKINLKVCLLYKSDNYLIESNIFEIWSHIYNKVYLEYSSSILDYKNNGWSKNSLFLFKLSHVKQLNLLISHERQVYSQASQVDFKESYTVTGGNSHRGVFFLFPEN